ncbi:hypothetical protein F7725_019416 [Dissostichus mawsoni]|uniref:Peptidase A2 domain-containing protein n=1 Tax=Dissostichus mawsoni TaxID=36200 RepID=A0A7J5YMP2_DISMA|nr:hypothetical protein F7725_019416 [Dissostichus mawsoni]
MDSLLSPLSPFLALPGEPPIPWVRWLESFETFIVAAGLAEANDNRKRALLIHTLGSEGQRIFRTLGLAPTVLHCSLDTLLLHKMLCSGGLFFGNAGNRRCCTVELDGVCLPLLLDTGASKSLLNVSTVRRLFPLRTLTADAEDLYGYGHSKIGMAGTITFAVRYGTKALPAFTFQVSHQGANLMGFDLFCELGFTLVDNSGAAILSVGSPWHQRWPALFSGLGCLTAFDHQPLLKPEVHPVIQPIRRLPLALRDDAAVSLEDLRLASEEDPTLSLLRTYIREGWPARFPEELASFHRLPLDRLRAPAAVTPTAAPCQSARVAEAQRRMKQRFDKRRRVRAPPFTAGDWVRIHRPNRDHKLLSFWTAPMKVTAQLGSATFRLADGSVACKPASEGGTAPHRGPRAQGGRGLCFS